MAAAAARSRVAAQMSTLVSLLLLGFLLRCPLMYNDDQDMVVLCVFLKISIRFNYLFKLSQGSCSDVNSGQSAARLSDALPSNIQ